MAERRMFAKTIIEADAFLDMPLSSQALYFHLSMRADDDGFLNNPKKIQREVGANANDYDLLIAKRFIIQFEDGICVIKHWRIHNYIRNDRYKETVYKEEKALLEVKKNGAYKLTDTIGIPNGYQMETQVRLGKDSIGKDNKDIVQPNGSTKSVCKKDIELFFEDVWKLFPNKKGKGKISDAKKKALYEIGNELYKAIDRYKTELEKDSDWRKPQNGSTFFNSGYVDYLDANYVPSSEKKSVATQGNPNNKFNQFPQRDYTQNDFMTLEQKLLEKSKTVHR